MIVFRASPVTHISEDPARYLHRRRALVRVVSRGASPVTARCPIQIRSRPLVKTKESSYLVNRFEASLLVTIVYPPIYLSLNYI